MDDLARSALVRGKILEFLETDPKQELSDAALQSAIGLGGYGLEVSTEQIRHQIEYLASKGYLEKRTKNHSLWSAKLTAHGVDLLEGRIVDDGIQVRP